MTRILESVCYPHQIFHIPKRHRSAFLQQRYGIGIFRILHPVGKAVCEVFSDVGFGIVPQRRGGSFCTKELFMLCGESQRPIEEMSEFMERRAGLREVDGFLAVVGGSNAAHVQLLAEVADVVEVDTVCPAGGVKGGKHRLRHLPQRHQVSLMLTPAAFTRATGAGGASTVKARVRMA